MRRRERKLAASRATLFVGAVMAASTAEGLAQDKKIGYGRHLASECTSCHRIDGIDNGIPSITGWDVGEFVTTMGFYREGSRENAAMRSVAQSLDETQVDALAVYFNTLPKPAKKK